MNNYINNNQQHDIINSFKQFSSSHNIHITLEMQPIEKCNDSEMNLNSIFQSAESIQYVDNVIILQNIKGKKILDIKKNKFDGELGSSKIFFDEDSQKYRQLYDESFNPKLNINFCLSFIIILTITIVILPILLLGFMIIQGVVEFINIMYNFNYYNYSLKLDNENESNNFEENNDENNIFKTIQEDFYDSDGIVGLVGYYIFYIIFEIMFLIFWIID